uniref:Uncharacterized protein n=1 Tax=Fagus sylvatica TaxID=28930 RepID=A0A2N9GPR8_FAGSY
MSSAPWRGEEEATEEFQDAKLKVTKQQPGAESVMHVPRKKKDKSNRHNHDNNDDDSLVESDPQLRYSFHRNYQTLLQCWDLGQFLVVVVNCKACLGV